MIKEDLRSYDEEDQTQLNEFMMSEGVIFNVSILLNKLRRNNL
jgi:hypothetical protein